MFLFKWLPAFIVFTFLAAPAFTGEPLFGYIYTTDTLPEGHFEFEQWLTDKEGQAHGHFHHFDMRSEVEYGVTDKLQVSLYVNYMYADVSGNSVQGKTEGMEIPYDHDSSKPYEAWRFDGISLESVYRVMSPYTDPFGLAFYVEPEFGTRESGVEFRAIAQKNYLDDQLVLAANLWVEFDREQSSNLVDPGSTDLPDGSWSNATYAELDLGASYRFASNWSAGLEFRNHNEYGGWTLAQSAQDHSAFFLGPNVHYASEKWFATLAVLRQLGAIAYSDDQKAQVHNNLLYGDEHTTWDGIRLIVGFPL